MWPPSRSFLDFFFLSLVQGTLIKTFPPYAWKASLIKLELYFNVILVTVCLYHAAHKDSSKFPFQLFEFLPTGLSLLQWPTFY